MPAKSLVQRTLLFLMMVMLAVVQSRKSYMIKEMIEQGKLKVHSPRVMATDCKWCFFNDANNDFCIEGDLNWRLATKTEQEYKADTVLGVPPHYNHTFIYQTTQSGSWVTRFNLKKLYYNQVTYTMNEFTTGFKFQFYYWKQDYAVCLNFLFFITPTDYSIVSANKLTKCDKVLIKCLDDWDNWSNKDEMLIGTCTLSSSEDITLYQYKPFENEYRKYFVGNDTFMENYCWPGHTPFYSQLMKYPNNPYFALLWSWLDLDMSFKSAFNKLPSNNKAFEGPTGNKSWSDILNDMVSVLTNDMQNYAGALLDNPPPVVENSDP